MPPSKPTRIHLIYAKAPGEVHNPRAALGAYIVTLARLLTHSGYHVLINAEAFPFLNTDKPAASEPLEKLTNAGRVQKIPSRLGFLPRPLQALLRDLRLRFIHLGLWRRLKGANAANVVLEISSTGSSLGARLARRLGVPFITLFDAPWEDEYAWFFGPLYPWQRAWLKKQEHTLIHASHRVLVYGPSVAQHLMKRHGLDDQRFVFHHNIDYARLTTDCGKRDPQLAPHILFLGSFLAWHQPLLLIEALTQLKQRGLAFRATLAGQGPLWEDVSQQIASHNLSDRVTLLGYQEAQALSDLKASANIGVIPGSNWYGAPVKVFEYAGAGLALVAPRLPTLEDLHHAGLSMHLFEPDRAVALADALAHLLTQPQQQHALAQAAKTYVTQHYTFEKDAQFFDQLVDRVLSENCAIKRP